MWVRPGVPNNWAETNVFMTRVFPGTINFQTFDQTPANN
jgi:hypothetical protein